MKASLKRGRIVAEKIGVGGKNGEDVALQAVESEIECLWNNGLEGEEV